MLFGILRYKFPELYWKWRKVYEKFKSGKEGMKMLDSTRLRNPQLFDKIVTPEEAAALITDGMNVGVSGFTPSGYPKKQR